MNAGRRLDLARWAAVYFALVFGAGFALGPVRVLWLEPRVGVRTAELIEAPFMLLAIVLAARWVGRNLRPGHGVPARLGVGVLTAGLVLVADVAVGVGLRGQTVVEVFTARDPVSGSVYYSLVAFTAVAPLFLGGGRGGDGRLRA
ncbi:MAG: hypothetical protein AB7N70_22670 [Dehalococcoidia bacterium]